MMCKIILLQVNISTVCCHVPGTSIFLYISMRENLENSARIPKDDWKVQKWIHVVIFLYISMRDYLENSARISKDDWKIKEMDTCSSHNIPSSH